MKKVFAILVPLFTLISFSAEAAQYYMSQQGDDRNPGTRERPWSSLQKSIWKMRAGDVLVIRGGTYRETSYSDIPQPSQGKLSTVRAENAETVIFDGRVSAKDAIEGEWKKLKPQVWRLRVQEKWRWIDGLWIDGKFYRKVKSELELTPGAWWASPKGNLATLYLEPGKDPSASNVEFRLEAMITFDTPYLRRAWPYSAAVRLTLKIAVSSHATS